MGLFLVVAPLLACLVALPWYPEQEGPAAFDGTVQPAKTFRQEPTPTLVRVAMWTLVATPVGAIMVVRFGVLRPDRLRSDGRRTLLLGTIIPSVILLIVGTAVLALLLLHLRMSIPLIIATEVAAWACWTWATTIWVSVGHYRTLGRSLGWDEEAPDQRVQSDDDDAEHRHDAVLDHLRP